MNVGCWHDWKTIAICVGYYSVITYHSKLESAIIRVVSQSIEATCTTDMGKDVHITSESDTTGTTPGFEESINVTMEETSSWTFHVESLRLFAHISLISILALCAIITDTSNLSTIPPPESTAIFKLFGFNHSCNWVDHNPSRMIAGILIPTFQVPMMLYVCLSHQRLKRSVRKSIVPNWLLEYSTITSPFNFVTFALLHMWFVNNPDDDYGFIPHYIPYFMLQISLSLMGFLNVQYLISTNNIPWGVKPGLAWAYQYITVGIAIICIMGVITLLLGFPFFDSVNNDVERRVFQAFSHLYAITIVVCPIAFAATERLNGDVYTIKFG